MHRNDPGSVWRPGNGHIGLLLDRCDEGLFLSFWSLRGKEWGSSERVRSVEEEIAGWSEIVSLSTKSWIEAGENGKDMKKQIMSDQTGRFALVRAPKLAIGPANGFAGPGIRSKVIQSAGSTKTEREIATLC
jgi:hypothetical protein